MDEKRKIFESCKKSIKEKVKEVSSKRLLLSFVIAVVLFALCLVLIKDMTVQEEKVAVLVTNSKISANQKITSVVDGIAVKEIPISMVPADAVKDLSQISGQFAVCDMGKGQVLTKYFFVNKRAMATELKEPLEVSVGVNSMDQIVGGVLREGDMVNICVVKENMIAGEKIYETSQVVSKAYVTRTFTNSGVSVSSEDEEQSAMIINILIEAAEEDTFNAALSEGKLRISLICN